MCHPDQSEAQICPVFTFHKSPSVTQSQAPPSPDAEERGGRLDSGESHVSPFGRFSKVYGWSIKLLSEKDCSFIRKKSPSDIIACSESDTFWKKLNKLVCFVKVEIIRKNLKVCFSFCLNPKLPSLPWLLESVLSISVLHLQGSLNLFLNALNSLDNNAFSGTTPKLDNNVSVSSQLTL